MNPTYRGAVEFNGDELEGAHEEIISDEDWRRAEAVRTAGPRRHSKGGPGRLPVGPHLFTRGLLRCGECGGPMSPHTGDTQLYACRNVECSTTSVRRAEIDTAAWSYFERVGLDVDATEAAAREAVESARAEARAASERAAQQQRKAAADLDRVRDDYTSGEITAAEWRQLREPLERAAAQAADDAAKAADLAERAEAGEAAAEGFTEHVAAQLAELRRAISGEIAGAEGLDGARAALVRLFDRFEIYAADRGDLPADQAEAAENVRAKIAATDQTVATGRWLIVPHPRAEAIAGHDLTPLLRRTTLGIKENDGVQMLSSANA